MDKDRTEICKIISEMLDNPDEHGIYQTSTAYTKLEHYIQQERTQAIGWTHADACVTLDNGNDPRTVNVPDILKRANKDLDVKCEEHDKAVQFHHLQVSNE